MNEDLKKHPYDIPNNFDSNESLKGLEQFRLNVLSKLKDDHPQLAEEVEAQRLPHFFAKVQDLWKEFQISLKGGQIRKNDGGKPTDSEVNSILLQTEPDEAFMQALKAGVNKLQYISEQEAKLIMGGYVQEVEEILKSDQVIMLVFEKDYGDNSSEAYFARMVLEMLDTKLQDRVLFSTELSSQDVSRLAQLEKVIVFRFDDSSNSGSQVISSIRSFMKLNKEILNFDFKVRLLASSSDNLADYVKERIDNPSVSEDDLAENHRANYELDVKQKYLNNRINVVYKDLAVTWGTSIIFAHKIQDNLPELFISLGQSHRRDKPHLLEMDHDIIPPYKSDLET